VRKSPELVPPVQQTVPKHFLFPPPWGFLIQQGCGQIGLFSPPPFTVWGRIIRRNFTRFFFSNRLWGAFGLSLWSAVFAARFFPKPNSFFSVLLRKTRRGKFNQLAAAFVFPLAKGPLLNPPSLFFSLCPSAFKKTKPPLEKRANPTMREPSPNSLLWEKTPRFFSKTFCPPLFSCADATPVFPVGLVSKTGGLLPHQPGVTQSSFLVVFFFFGAFSSCRLLSSPLCSGVFPPFHVKGLACLQRVGAVDSHFSTLSCVSFLKLDIFFFFPFSASKLARLLFSPTPRSAKSTPSKKKGPPNPRIKPESLRSFCGFPPCD